KTRVAGRLLRKLLQNLGEVPKLRSSELRCVGVRILDSDDPGEIRLNDRLPVFWVCCKGILGDTEQNSLRDSHELRSRLHVHHDPSSRVGHRPELRSDLRATVPIG